MLEVDKKTFEEEVLKAEGYVFVDFFGDGCVPCQALMPKVHEYADTYGDKMKFTCLNNKGTSSCNLSENLRSAGYGNLQRRRESRRAGKR